MPSERVEGLRADLSAITRLLSALAVGSLIYVNGVNSKPVELEIIPAESTTP